MKWKKYKKTVRKLVGKNNCKFKKENSKYYMALRLTEITSSYRLKPWIEVENIGA